MSSNGSTETGRPPASSGTASGVDQAAGSSPTKPRNIPDGFVARQLWLLGVRRQFLVNRRRQLRTAAMILALVVGLLILVNFLFHALRSQETDVIVASAPALREVMADYDRNELLLGILASVVVLAGVFVVTIIETHRTAGAALNISRQLRRLADGRYDARLVLRKGDNLRELEAPFNDMVRALRDRASEDIEALERLAEAVEAQVGDTASKVIGELRSMAAAKRQRIDPQ